MDRIKFKRRSFAHPSSPDYCAAAHWYVIVNEIRDVHWYILYDAYRWKANVDEGDYLICRKNGYSNVSTIDIKSTLHLAKRALLEFLYLEKIADDGQRQGDPC